MTDAPAPPVGPFEPPPVEFEDGAGRPIEVRLLPDEPGSIESLVTMYEGFDPEDRAQGLPPVGESAVREWLDTLADACNVVAVHGDRVVGHATLVPDGDSAHELAIFVHQEYQGAGIGTRLMHALLGHGAQCGVDDVWLTVERWNRAAVALYEKLGFERVSVESFALEMAARIAPPDDAAE